MFSRHRPPSVPHPAPPAPIHPLRPTSQSTSATSQLSHGSDGYPRKPKGLGNHHPPRLARSQQSVTSRTLQRAAVRLLIQDLQVRVVCRVPRLQEVMKSHASLLYIGSMARVRVDHVQNVPATFQAPEGILHDNPHLCMLMVEAPHCCYVWAVHIDLPEWRYLWQPMAKTNEARRGEGQCSHPRENRNNGRMHRAEPQGSAFQQRYETVECAAQLSAVNGHPHCPLGTVKVFVSLRGPSPTPCGSSLVTPPTLRPFASPSLLDPT